jgi:hypothetical protein
LWIKKPSRQLPQDGQETQACERAAGTRGLTTHAPQVAPYGVTVLGDALYSQQPWCTLALREGYHCIFVCKPDAHPNCYARLAFWQAKDGMTALEHRHGHGRFTAVRQYRYPNDVLLRGGDQAVSVTWFEITVVHTTTGAPLYPNSCITNPPVPVETVAAVAHAGRSRWKSENESNHVLKTTGSHVEHNFGHGQQSLAALLLSLNLLAFWFHTVLEWSDDRSALLRRVLARRQTFCDDIRALTRSMVFDHWQHLMDCMIRGLELDPTHAPKLNTC